MVATAYVTNTDSDDISVVDLKRRKETNRIRIGGSPRGSVRFDPKHEFGYVSNCAGNTISVLDLRQKKEIDRIQVGLAPRGLTLSANGRLAYVSNSGDSSLSVVDLKQRREVRRIAMKENPRHMVLVAKANRLLVTQWGADSLALIDLGAGPDLPEVLSSTKLGKGARPYSVAATKDGKIALVANTQADYVSIVDVKSGGEKRRVQVGHGGRAAVFTPDSKYAFVSVENSNELVVIRMSNFRVVKRVEVGPSPRGVAVSPSLMEVYSVAFTRTISVGFGNKARNSMTIVDATDPEEARVNGHVPVGLGPCSVSVWDDDK